MIFYDLVSQEYSLQITQGTPDSPSTISPVSAWVFSQRKCESISRICPNQNQQHCPTLGMIIPTLKASAPILAIPAILLADLAAGHHPAKGLQERSGTAAPAASTLETRAEVTLHLHHARVLHQDAPQTLDLHPVAPHRVRALIAPPRPVAARARALGPTVTLAHHALDRAPQQETWQPAEGLHPNLGLQCPIRAVHLPHGARTTTPARDRAHHQGSANQPRALSHGELTVVTA